MYSPRISAISLKLLNQKCADNTRAKWRVIFHCSDDRLRGCKNSMFPGNVINAYNKVCVRGAPNPWHMGMVTSDAHRATSLAR